MTMTNASPPSRGRRVKFTQQAIEKIKEFVAGGISRDEIANRLGVTVGSLQVTRSRLGISLRRIISPNGSRRHTADVRPGSVGIAHVREQKGVSQPEACAALRRPCWPFREHIRSRKNSPLCERNHLSKKKPVGRSAQVVRCCAAAADEQETRRDA